MRENNRRKLTTNNKRQTTRRSPPTDWTTTKRGSQPQTRRTEQWTVDPFWNLDRPTTVQPFKYDQPGTSTSNLRQGRNTPIPMEEGEIDSETDQDQSVLEVPAINWARHVGVKSVQYVKMGHAPKIIAEEDKN